LVLVAVTATLLSWGTLVIWGEVGIRMYLLRFDLDANGFVEGQELTEEAIAAELNSNDTWRLGFAILAPLLYSAIAALVFIGRKFVSR
jgi:hypothetical protein